MCNICKSNCCIPSVVFAGLLRIKAACVSLALEKQELLFSSDSTFKISQCEYLEMVYEKNISDVYIHV